MRVWTWTRPLLGEVPTPLGEAQRAWWWYMWTTLSQCPSHRLFWHHSKPEKDVQVKVFRYFLISQNTLTTILRSFKWQFCMQQENITTNKGKYSPLKIFSYPVNPHHRESMRSCPLNTGGLPQQRNWTWLQTLEPHTSKSNLEGKIIQTKEKAKSGRVYTPRLNRPVQERKTTRCGGLTS